MTCSHLTAQWYLKALVLFVILLAADIQRSDA